MPKVPVTAEILEALIASGADAEGLLDGSRLGDELAAVLAVWAEPWLRKTAC